MGKLRRKVKAYLDENTGSRSIRYDNIPKEAEYISFDIFDTLVIRDINKPADLFSMLEKQLHIKGFAEKRIAAERAAREKKPGGEVTISEIYGCFPGISREQAESLVQSELEAELSVCRADPDMLGIYRKCVKSRKVILVSDMYLPSGIMKKILEKCGITGYEKLYISCDAGVSKRSGGLYGYVISDLGIPAGKMFHIGNDFIADLTGAKKAGVKSFKIQTKRRSRKAGKIQAAKVSGDTYKPSAAADHGDNGNGKPLVSVIIPVYNVEKYLRECVDSVIGQTYKALEIILVDDGSPDNCGKICDEYAAKDSRITVIHKENGGLSDARNTGFAKAAGKYVYFIDSDDYLLDSAIERLAETAEENRADIVFMDIVNFNESGFAPSFSESLVHKRKYPIARGTEIINAMFRENDYMCVVQAHFYRRDFLNDNSLRFVKGLIFEDLMFNGSAFLLAERVCSLNESLYMRRMRPGSIMTSNDSLKNVRSYRYIFRRFLSFYLAQPDGTPEKEAYRNLVTLAANMCIIRYTGVRGRERRASFRCINDLKRTLIKYRYFGRKNLLIKYSIPEVYSVYMEFKRTMTVVFCKAKEKLYCK